MHSAGSFNSREQIRKELLVTLAVEYEHRYTAPVVCRTNDAKEILGDDVLEQCCLPRTGGPEYDRLHDASCVGPEPRFSVHVIPEHDCILVVGSLDGLPVAFGRYI